MFNNIQKYKIFSNPLNLKVKELLDFQDMPILNLEEDCMGNQFLSYLVSESNDIEKRILIQITKERLSQIIAGNIAIKTAFNLAESKHIYACEFGALNGVVLNTYLIPIIDFQTINPIPNDYFINTY